MRAAVMFEAGGAFEMTEVELAEPGPLDVRVDLRAAGVCASDLSLTTAFGQPTPVVLGHEGAGVVDAVGDRVTGVAVGDHVVVLWVAPCGTCVPCRRGDEYLCASRRSSADQRAGRAPTRTSPLTIGGSPVHQGLTTATFAEATVVPANAVVKIAEDVPWPVAALLGCAVPTGVGAALRSARVQPGDDVAVIGCGAVGLNALLGAVVAGAARIVALDPMESRQALAVELGATIASSPQRLAEHAPYDVVIDAVGRPTTVQAAWDAVRRGGTVTVVGAGRPDEVVELNAYQVFHDDKRLTGSFHGGISMRRDLSMLVDLWRSGRLPVERLIDKTVDLSEINEVVAAQQSGSVLRTMMFTGGTA